MRIGVVNGPKLNLLGQRDPTHYGRKTLPEIEAMLAERARSRDVRLDFFQADDEPALVDWIASRASSVDGWLVNAGRLTHTGRALREALGSAGRPFVELHLSNVYSREPFRHTSLLADLAVGVIAGFKENSYLLALDALIEHLEG